MTIAKPIMQLKRNLSGENGIGKQILTWLCVCYAVAIPIMGQGILPLLIAIVFLIVGIYVPAETIFVTWLISMFVLGEKDSEWLPLFFKMYLTLIILGLCAHAYLSILRVLGLWLDTEPRGKISTAIKSERNYLFKGTEAVLLLCFGFLWLLFGSFAVQTVSI